MSDTMFGWISDTRMEKKYFDHRHPLTSFYMCNVPRAITDDELLFFGTENLLAMAIAWEKEIQQCRKRIAVGNSYLALLEETANGLGALALAEQSEDPENILWEPGEFKRRIPCDLTTFTRKPGSTNCRRCGWCRFCSGDKRHYHSKIKLSGYCEILSFAGVHPNGVEHHTPCKITSMPEKKCLEMREPILHCIGEYESNIRKVEENIQALLELAVRSEEKPAFTSLRQKDHFKRGDKVMVLLAREEFVTDWTEACVVEVQKDYILGNSLVLYFKKPIFQRNVWKGSAHVGTGFKSDEPNVLHEWEHWYMQVAPNYWKLWLAFYRDFFRHKYMEQARAGYELY